MPDMRTVPRQFTGAHSQSSYQVRLRSVQEAKQVFSAARDHLLHVDRWHSLAGTASASFKAVDNSGVEHDGPIEKGNYLRISIPVVPNAPIGTGDDWVKVEVIDEREDEAGEHLSIRVRPCKCPTTGGPQAVAHFFDEHATSTFTVERKGPRVRVSVIGRNEKPNTKTPGLVATVRNFFIAVGAMIGLNKPQWQSLVKGLVTKSLEQVNATKASPENGI